MVADEVESKAASAKSRLFSGGMTKRSSCRIERIEVEEEEDAEDGEMRPVDDRDLWLTIRGRNNDEAMANGSSRQVLGQFNLQFV